jgi:hypothetical protein
MEMYVTCFVFASTILLIYWQNQLGVCFDEMCVMTGVLKLILKITLDT